MVNNSFYKCSYCGTTLRFRYQVGYLNIPVSIYCPKCNCHISGKIYIDQDRPSISESIIGANRLRDDRAEYLIELATAFLVKKCRLNTSDSVEISMFLRSDPFDNERTTARRNLLDFALCAGRISNDIENLYNLLKKDKPILIKEWFSNQGDSVFEPYKDGVDYNNIVNRLDAMLAIKHYINRLLGPTFPSGVFQGMYDIMNVKVRRIVTNHKRSFVEYLSFTDDKLLDTYFYRLPKFFVDYLKRIEQLIPVYDSYFIKNTSELENIGVSTISIDDLSNVYKKGFELVCDTIDFIAGLYNIENRGHFDDFGSGRINFRDKVNGFTSKFNKYKAFTDNTSDLYDGIRDKLNNTIRNAEGHNSITVNGLSQEVTFHNKHKGKENTLTLSFIDFGKECINLYCAVSYVWEYLYQIVKYKAILIDNIELHYGL